MRIFSLYNIWISCSEWDLLHFTQPRPDYDDSEALSLAMVAEIDDRLLLQNKKENMEVWGNGGTLPPMSPEAHSSPPC